MGTMRDYTGKTVWITGASSGLGEALAYAFAARGARLILSARRTDKLERVARSSGAREAHVVPLDLSDLENIAPRARAVLDQFGPVDILVHNAGVGQRSLAVETDFNVERKMMDTNFLGPVALTKTLLPDMIARKRGQLVVVSSVLGLFSMQRRSAYCASKHALHGYFNALRAELHQHHISVLLVCPGHVQTEFSESAFEGDGSRYGVTDPTTKSGLSAGEVAEQTMRALEQGRDEVHVTKWESLAIYANRLSPSLLRRALTRVNMRRRQS